MSLKSPGNLPDPSELKKAIESPFPKTLIRKYQCKLFTPMYGGGVKAGVVDRDMPIRASAIRGQLRFWWRLVVRNECFVEGKLDTKKMFERERNIWGGLGDEKSLAASKVRIRVMNYRKTPLEACGSYAQKKDGTWKTYPDWKNWANGYALFPAQGKCSKLEGVSEQPRELLLPGARWEMELTAEGLSESDLNTVLDAVRWWASFGGVGARTRRGLGAVEVRDFSENRLLAVNPGEIGKEFDFRVMDPEKDAVTAMQLSVQKMQNFRQGVGTGRNPPDTSGGSQSPAGRSRWPEPDAIRKITGKHAKSPRDHSPVHRAEKVFPRAAFGMPIIFHFISTDEPGDSEVLPLLENQKGEMVEMTRMASPVILRPFPAGNGQWHPAALRLPDDHVRTMGIRLKNSGKGRNNNLPKDFRQGNWWQPEKSSAIPPMKNHPEARDALQAFMAHFGTKDSSQVLEESLKKSDGEVWEKAQIKFNRRNGSLTAAADGKEANAIGEAADKLLENLPKPVREKIKQNQFVRLKATVDNQTLLKLEEIQ